MMWPQFAADQAKYDATLATDLAAIPPGQARDRGGAGRGTVDPRVAQHRRLRHAGGLASSQ
jgi:hypothetical protein